jgi:hypothetical protein
MSPPSHIRKHDPGTAGRNEVRDTQICDLAAIGMTNAAIGKEFGLSKERVRQIVGSAKGKSDGTCYPSQMRIFDRVNG